MSFTWLRPLTKRARVSSKDGAKRRQRARYRLAVELLEARCLLSTFRSITGTGNNLAHPEWGSAGVDLLRKAPAAYADGISAPVAGNPPRPSPRHISNVVVDQGDQDILNRRRMSAFIYAWGQFLDHDIDLTTNASPRVPFNISATDPGDPFNPPGVIFFNRSKFDPATGTSPSNPRQQPNEITAFIDASQVYGSEPVRADALRTHAGGRLKTSPGNLLPFNNATYFGSLAPLANANDSHIVPDDQLFVAGDVRANENIELTSLHTLFVREHNRLADRIHATAPALSDEQVYQIARSIVGAEMQVITYQEWIPALLGPNALPAYAGYQATVNPGIANEFSTAAFRVGHSMLGNDIEFLDEQGKPVRPAIALSEGFFNPPLVSQNGLGPILKYLASDIAQEIDTKIVNSVRNFLFGPPGAGGFDLSALNMQRGRDHGLADYNTIRAAYGLPRVTTFAQITSNVTLQNQLRELYGNVDNLDAWLGGLAEDHVPGTSTGPLIRRVLLDQFQRLRDGDRYWYQREFSGLALFALEHTRLSDIIRRNSDLFNIQKNVFFFRLDVSGTVFDDVNRNGHRELGEPALAGWTVQLLDDTSTVVASTPTSSSGFYHFNNFDGLDLGTFQVRVVPKAGWTPTTVAARPFTFTRGNIDVRGVNFGFFQSRSAPGGGGSTVADGALLGDLFPAGPNFGPEPSGRVKVSQTAAGAADPAQVAERAFSVTPPPRQQSTGQGLALRQAASSVVHHTSNGDEQVLADILARDQWFAQL